MAKNQSGGSSDGLCSKIHKAFRRISHSQQSSNSKPPATSPPFPPPPPVPVQKKPATTEANSIEIPISFNATQTHGSAPKNGLGHTQMAKVAPEKAKSLPKKEVDDDPEREFSEFIKCSKDKISAPSSVWEKKTSVSRADSLNDRITNYIAQAKIRIARTPTTKPGGKRSVPVK